MFGKRTAEKTAGLPVIVVPQSALDSTEHYVLPRAVVDFVNHALHKAMFERTEIPQAAMWVYHVDYYVAQVNNGGHSQYVGNSGWHQHQIDDIRAGLRALGIREATELYDDLCAYADSNPEEFRNGMNTCGFGDFSEFFKKADKLFYAGIGEQLMRANGQWIRALECLMVLRDDQYRQVMDDLYRRNPKFDERSECRERLGSNLILNDPFYQACSLVVGIEDRVNVVKRMNGMKRVQGPEGAPAVCIDISLMSGANVKIYLLADCGFMLDVRKNDEPKLVSMAAIQDWVKRRTGRTLSSDLFR